MTAFLTVKHNLQYKFGGFRTFCETMEKHVHHTNVKNYKRLNLQMDNNCILADKVYAGIGLIVIQYVEKPLKGVGFNVCHMSMCPRPKHLTL